MLQKMVPRPPRKIPDRDILYRLYIEEGTSLRDIGRMYNVSATGVQLGLAKYDIPLRNKSQSRLLALGQGKFARPGHVFNRNFFDSWSPAMAYVLGITFAEATIAKSSVVFVFGKKSLAILHNITALMGSNHSPTLLNNNGFPGWRMVFASTTMVQTLSKYGLLPGANSKRIRIPANMPKEYMRHFVRGYWEGDGTASSRLAFYTSSYGFICDLQSVMQEYLDAYVKISEQGGGEGVGVNGGSIHRSPSYSLHYCSNTDKLNLYQWFYRNVDDRLYSLPHKRKFEAVLPTAKSGM